MANYNICQFVTTLVLVSRELASSREFREASAVTIAQNHNQEVAIRDHPKMLTEEVAHIDDGDDVWAIFEVPMENSTATRRKLV